MGKFESYPETNTLNSDDITLYNKNTITHKITFGKLVNLIKNKISENGLVTSFSTGAGLTGGTISSTGTIKCSLKSETLSRLSSTDISVTDNRQYAVGLDHEGKLSVNVPWVGAAYTNGAGITLINNTISANLTDTALSPLVSLDMSSTANRQYAVGLDANGKLSVNVPWTASMTTNGSNADAEVKFSGAFTVGSRVTESIVGINSVAEGYGNKAEGDYSHAEGLGNNATHLYAHVEGNNNTASGKASHAEGYGNTASGEYCHAEGSGCVASGENSHAEGVDTEALGSYCHVEGMGSVAKFVCVGSHVEGINVTVEGQGCHAEGSETEAKSFFSHAEGNLSKAYGEASHAEGYDTKTQADYSHAEGYRTQANELYSHAAGYSTTTNAQYSHAGGAYVTTNGVAQFAYGGVDNKFSNSNLGRGVFGVQANCKYYGTNTTIAQNVATCGVSASVLGGVSITVELPRCAMYMLYWASYNTNTSQVNCNAALIATSQSATGTPHVQEFDTSTIIDSVLSNNKIVILDSDDYMFSLMRII